MILSVIMMVDSRDSALHMLKVLWLANLNSFHTGWLAANCMVEGKGIRAQWSTGI